MEIKFALDRTPAVKKVRKGIILVGNYPLKVLWKTGSVFYIRMTDREDVLLCLDIAAGRLDGYSGVFVYDITDEVGLGVMDTAHLFGEKIDEFIDTILGGVEADVELSEVESAKTDPTSNEKVVESADSTNESSNVETKEAKQTTSNESSKEETTTSSSNSDVVVTTTDPKKGSGLKWLGVGLGVLALAAGAGAYFYTRKKVRINN